jgi:DNA-binding MarR family transcriptional regulator
MDTNMELQMNVVRAIQQFGVESVLFRNVIGKKLGLTMTETNCMNYLFIKGVATPTEIARYTGLTSGSTTTMLDRLEHVGFVHRKANPKDRRGTLIEVNQEAREKIASMVAGAQQAQRELLARYTDAELVAIADFLTCFTKNVAEYSHSLET